jgi:hypothetical protein
MRPSGDHLLVLETRARREGTGLTSRDLIGRWQLHTVWPKGTARPAAFNSSLLRGLGAALAFTPLDTAPNAPLRITNTVSLGRLELSFVGQAELSGRRPLLRFHFEWLRLRLGERLLFERGLPRPEERRRPFFALIGIGPQGGWLAARGRGGGLALWCRSEAPAR